MKKTIAPIVLFAAMAAQPTLAQPQDHKMPMPDLNQVNMPLFQTKYTADPSPLVIGDTLFLYTSHDASP
ncbi:MAG: carbohydrate-binding protein, partial [Bacteroidaceae bacterium]|nr:carbohydrate-binding protein [Bacteroidaceae bacterium]